MKTTLCVGTAAVAFGLVAGMGCNATEADDEVPALGIDEVSEQSFITNVNAAGTWTAEAILPPESETTGAWLTASRAVFTGPAGATRRMGVCELYRGRTPANATKNCNTSADCLDAPSALPSGGFRYCTAPSGVAMKSCWYRPGPPTARCAGTPANGLQPVQPDAYQSPFQPRPSTEAVISYACFEGCSGSDPSVSSPLRRERDFLNGGGKK